MKTDNVIAVISAIREKANKFIIIEMKTNGIEGLVPSHGAILYALFEHKTLTMKDIAKIVNKDKSTVTALVDKLTDLGYIKKEHDPFDNRVTLVSITEKGALLKPTFEDISQKLLSNIYKDIPIQEREQLITSLTKILNNL